MLIDSRMGPNPLWLWRAVDLPPGSRVPDLGCDRALTSIFLACGFGVRVVAADLVPAAQELGADPRRRLRRQRHAAARGGARRSVAHGYFDAVTIVDAYQYFGTADQYLCYLTQFLRPGGVAAIAEVGLTREISELPEHWRAVLAPGLLAVEASAVVASTLYPQRRGGCRRGRADAGWGRRSLAGPHGRAVPGVVVVQEH